MNYRVANFRKKLGTSLSLWRSSCLLKKVTPGPVSIGAEELTAIVPVRNDAARLPLFLEYYRSKGVDRFLFVDNDSSDGSAELLKSQSDVILFRTRERYSQSRNAVNWYRILLQRWLADRWVLLLDTDEILIYPHWEKLSIKDVCRFMETEAATALRAPLLDMYGDGFPPLPAADGRPLWEVFPYFDRDITPFTRFTGGLRRRVFGLNVNLHKSPLIKFNLKMHFDHIHRIKNVVISSCRGALFHFKFDATFRERSAAEAQRKEHWNQAAEYQRYAEISAQSEEFSLRDPASLKFEDWKQLAKLGIIKNTQFLDRFAATISSPRIPTP